MIHFVDRSCVALSAAVAALVVAPELLAVQEVPAPSAVTESAPQASRVIEGAVNPYSYNPKNTEGHTDLDLRGMLEGLGPVAIEWYQHVMTLSNPFFEGRVPASRGGALAGEYIEFYLRQYGLEPAFPEPPVNPAKPASAPTPPVAVSTEGAMPPPESPSSHPEWTHWRQPFDLAGGGPKLVRSDVSWSDAAASEGTQANALARGKAYAVLGNSGSSKFTGPIAFAGYAIEDGDGGYTSFGPSDDFAGRAVMFLRYEPLDKDGRSQWADRRFSPAAAVAPKMDSLAARHASAIIMVNPPGARDGKRTLESSETSRFGGRLDIPVIQLSAEEADRLVRVADPEHRSLLALREAADEGKLRPVKFTETVAVSIDAEMSEGLIQTENIGAVLRGRGALADQWVIVGAHYDHVGFGNYGADPSNRGVLHPGADDNASGTSAMLCTAKALSEYYRSADAPAEMRSVLFMAFSAEEVGLDGSDHWTKHPTLKNEQVQAMINLDMVGRMRNDELAIGGTGTAKEFMATLKPTFEASGLTIRADPSGRGPSDHASFYRAGIPVLFLFTGSHDDYHKPTDRGHTVNPQGAAKVIGLTESLVKLLAATPSKLEFASTDGTATAGRRTGAKVRLGVMPGYGSDGVEGVKVDGVSAETAAADAGILAGDLLIAWNDSMLTGPADMMERLREHNPGDVVKVKLIRDGAERVVEVKLRASKAE